MVDDGRGICRATRRDGEPCTAVASDSGYCFGHDPKLEDKRREARRQGGQNKASSVRVSKLLPTRLKPVATALEEVLTEVHNGSIDPKVATAMASVATALIRVYSTSELEERLRNLEATFNGSNRN